MILERRPFVGGACNTETFAPGFRASTGAYVLSMLRRAVWHEMRLSRRGVVVDPAGPTLNLYADGARYMLGDDMGANVAETRRFSPRDADALPRFEDDLDRLVGALLPTFDRAPPDPETNSVGGVLDLGAWARLGLRFRRRIADLSYLFAASVTQILEERFTSEHVRAALGWHAINDSSLGPSTPGTGFVLLHDHASEDPGGGIRQWGFVRGGMGRVTEAMADAARDAGCEIRCDAEVARILTRDRRSVGVELADGRQFLAKVVLSNADPKRTFLTLCDASELPDEFVAAIRAYRSDGTSIKINLALRALPSIDGANSGDVEPYHTGILEVNPTLAEMDAQQWSAAKGIPADPAHIELCFPTVHDPSLAPEGKHVATIDVNSQPYALAEGDWDALREERADRAIQQLSTYFPRLPDLVEHRQVLTPLDIERVMGITGGHALHGDMSTDQLFFLRPVRGWARYRTPIRGLYLCGAGTHPGGGVTGANGRNCAHEVLKDLRRLRRW